ncbi:GMC oxidoreductase [Hydrogenophaga sp. A37]|uniref:GMC oxidoreductase n=1 Tax=Hydrogenophaga sp. A37 TaxID=1945864 RepID=UPI0009CC29C4|nr:GMC family oxidoreductase [Hydrogenophaga sp. A37]OOG79521.1 hypothetical protein B0E41_23360 [Hydrogenophaga sp. A37]
MPIEDLAAIGDARIEKCDFLIVGGGPAGLTIARGLAEAGRSSLVLESGGLVEHESTEALNETLCETGTWSPHQAVKRERFHAHQTRMWAHGRQAFGVRCRALGGSTAAWAGKSAAFSEVDFAARYWVPDSGWPVSANDLVRYLDKAADALNLGINCYDGRLWDHLRRAPPQPHPDPSVLGSFFWQFARSTLAPTDVLRVGEEFIQAAPRGCRVLTGATVLEVLTDESGERVCAVRVADASGARRTIEAQTIILAASAIENARLLLNSRSRHANGLGNDRDLVGRYLLDHPCARVASFSQNAIASMSQLYGFYGLRGKRGVSMYMHGLAPTARVQEEEGILNCAAYTMGERAPDDPWSAAKRLLKRQSESRLSDAHAILKSPGIMAKGLARLAFQSDRFPKAWSRFAVNQVLRYRPGLAVEEYLTRGLPHKLVGLSIDALCEQAPDRDNRIQLSSRNDRFGMPLPVARWRIGELEIRTLTRLAHILRLEFGKAGLPQPVIAPWIADRDTHGVDIIDMGHSAGTTRMASDPGRGVVDADCKVHGIEGLYVAGASIFPTCGHANPTLMIMTFAYRLAEHLAQRR